MIHSQFLNIVKNKNLKRSKLNLSVHVAKNTLTPYIKT